MLSPFMGIGRVPKKNDRKIQPFSERNIFTVAPARVLLSSLQREKILNDIKEIVAAPAEPYDNLYVTLINNFVEFVQIVPVTNESRLASLIDEGLLRALFALRVQKQEAGNREAEPLMRYMIFSVALLFDVGYASGERTINIVNKDGEFLEIWNPAVGAMKLESCYKIRRGGGMPPDLSRRAAASLAQKIMPGLGYSWITRDAHAFNAWLALLYGEYKGIESLRIYLDRALELLEEFKLQQEWLMPVDVEITTESKVEWGEEFVEWLQTAILDGTISINAWDSVAHVVQGALFLELGGLFAEFCKKFPRAPDYDIVIGQFQKLGFVNLVDGGINTSRYFFSEVKASLSHASLFGESGVKKTTAVLADKIGALVEGKAEPLDKESRKLGLAGWRSGVIIDGPNAGSLLGRLNMSAMPNSNYVQRVEGSQLDMQNASKALAENYPSTPKVILTTAPGVKQT